MPKVSVIIPVYNKEKYLEISIRSVLDQTFQDFEIIAVNDGSKDRSLEILQKFAEQDNRLRIIDIPNGGVSHARNVGLGQARGEYITFIDADDSVHSGFLANLYDCITSSSADLVISGFQKFWDDGRKDGPFVLPFPNGIYSLEELLPCFIQVQLQTGVYGCCTSKIFPRKFLNIIKFDESLSLAEDFDFYLNLYDQAKTIYVDHHAWYDYRQETENSSSVRSDYDCDYTAQLNIYLRCRSFLKKHGAYHQQNKKLIEEKLQDYLCFSVFYCKQNHMLTQFTQLERIMEQEQISPMSPERKKRLLLHLLASKHFFVLQVLLKTYRVIQNLLKRGT